MNTKVTLCQPFFDSKNSKQIYNSGRVSIYTLFAFLLNWSMHRMLLWGYKSISCFISNNAFILGETSLQMTLIKNKGSINESMKLIVLSVELYHKVN